MRLLRLSLIILNIPLLAVLMEVPRFSTEIYRAFLGESASVLGLRPMIVGRLSKTSSGLILSDFLVGYTDSPQPGLLTNLFRRGAA